MPCRLEKIDLIQIKLLVFDFDGIFTDNMVYISEDGKESVRCSRFDGIGLSKLKSLGLQLLIISSEKNPVVQHRAKKLNVECFYNVPDKLTLLEEIMKKLQLQWNQIAYFGNDCNDKECLEKVGLPIVVPDAHESVISLGKFVTRKKGGEGAVRELADLWAKILS